MAQVVGATDTYDGRAVALADFGNRGALDVDRRQPARPAAGLSQHASQPGRHWIQFELEGTASNRSAIGARVELQWNGRRQVQEVSGGERLRGAEPAAAALRPRRERRRWTASSIRWPSGRQQTIEHPQVDMLHRITEPHAG